MSVSSCQVAIIGAGPYGLAAAAHLRDAGVVTRIFGEPMGFWRGHMPRGMCLISPRKASDIASPRGAFSLDAYAAEQGRALTWPLPLEDFIAYGQWFQRRAVPDLDRRLVRWVEGGAGRFRLILEDGESLHAQCVVIATGLGPFASRPAPFADLPRDLVSHSADHNDLGTFAGRRVAVIGAGQSAIMSAVLLREAGAVVE